MELFFDTETTGLVLFKEPHTHKGQPNIVQIGAILSDEFTVYAKLSAIVFPGDIDDAWIMSDEVTKIHGITTNMARHGLPTLTILGLLNTMVEQANVLICHNVDFDKKMVQVASARGGMFGEVVLENISSKPVYCTMKNSTNLCKLPGRYGNYKWPKLMELHKFLFNEEFEGAHDALPDVMATRRCYYELKKRGL